jgi:hypothetical protein
MMVAIRWGSRSPSTALLELAPAAGRTSRIAFLAGIGGFAFGRHADVGRILGLQLSLSFFLKSGHRSRE